MIEYAANLKSYIDAIRLITVDVEVIEMTTSGIVHKMSFEEYSQLNTGLVYINTERKEESECALDRSKNVKDHFPGDCMFSAMVNRETSIESDDSSVDPDTDDELVGSKSDSYSIASKSSDTRMEDITKVTSCIDLTDIDKTK